MRILTHMMLMLSSAVGVVACNPGSADAHLPQTQTMAVKKANLAEDTKLTNIVVATQSTHIIEIHKMKFQTKMLNVKIGDTVTWVNKDIVPHTATANDKSWDSGRLKKGESFTLTITSQTNLDYFCFYHRQMKAKLVLTAPT